MRTTTLKPPAPCWVTIDAAGQRIGKVAVKAAILLKGKHRPTYAPHQLCGDHVIVVNARKLSLPPKKGIRKVYERHTGFPGHMKVRSLEQMLAQKPEHVVELAVRGMLPSNRLAIQMMRRLHVFADQEHPYGAQKPIAVSLARS